VTYSGPCHPSMSPPSNKRRRMSTDSAREPPSSATSVSSFGGRRRTGTVTFQLAPPLRITPGRVARISPSRLTNRTARPTRDRRGPGNTFWPPMMPQPQSDSETFWHPPLIPPTKDQHISRFDAEGLFVFKRRFIGELRPNCQDYLMQLRVLFH
jgi:GATA-binding protein